MKIGVAGLGYWGPNLARNFDLLADLSWICDASPGLLEKQAKRYPGARATTRFKDMLEDPELDAVVIATPVPTHAPLAKQALEAGKNVFVEKPMAMNAADAE